MNRNYAPKVRFNARYVRRFLPLLIITLFVHIPSVNLQSPLPSTSDQEWTQHAHDAQHTSFTPGSVPTPWRWKWAWNGPDNAGGISDGKTTLPGNVQPVTGGGRVYVAAGSRGVFALDGANGTVIWNNYEPGTVNSTVAYDAESVFVVSANGTLYKLDAATGEILAQFASGSSSSLPLPPAVIADRVFFSMGSNLFAIDKDSMQEIWRYNAESEVHTPPAYSVSRDRVVVVSQDLVVHAVRNSDGQQAWRVTPTIRNSGDPGVNDPSLAEAANGWPVVAESVGYVLVRYRLDYHSTFNTYGFNTNPWPSDNESIRDIMQSQPEQQNLFVLDLDDGSIPFIANVGPGGWGDSIVPMGPQPALKMLSDGKQVVWIPIRGGSVSSADRWDSHLGEMVLDSDTVPGLQAGFVRWMDSYAGGSPFPSDEAPFISVSGDDILGGHWMFGIARTITDRSASRGSFQNPIETQTLPHIVSSSTSVPFSASHYSEGGLENDGDSRFIPFGFYMYYNQPQLYDQYWSDYATWVVSNHTIYYRSVDGAIIALDSGNPTVDLPQSPDVAQNTSVAWTFDVQPSQEQPIPSIAYTEAHVYAGQTVIVTGTIRDILNNGQAVYVGFTRPHKGAFKIRILREYWENFDTTPDGQYTVGESIQVRGTIDWYQGDPVIYVTSPDQIWGQEP